MEEAFNEFLRQRKSPFYLFDSRVLKERVAYLRRMLPKETGLCYAVKANPFLVREMGETVERFELCSPGEVEICRSLGIPSENMVVSGVYKPCDRLEEWIRDPQFHAIFTAESPLQYRQLCELAARYRHPIRVLLRLTEGSQFGMDESETRDIIASRSDHPEVRILGLQFFSGTQKTSLKKIRRELTMLKELFASLSGEYGFEAEELEYGPGFPVSYFEGDSPEEEAYLEEVSRVLLETHAGRRVTLELGRSIAASCGTYYTRIVDLKTNRGRRYAMVDGGMHQIVYYGQHMAMRHPKLTVHGKENESAAGTWSVCGALCTMNDILVKQVELPAISVGDVLCFPNAGAYCMTEGISLFLSRELPAIYIRKEDGQVICVRESFETCQLNRPNYA